MASASARPLLASHAGPHGTPCRSCRRPRRPSFRSQRHSYSLVDPCQLDLWSSTLAPSSRSYTGTGARPALDRLDPRHWPGNAWLAASLRPNQPHWALGRPDHRHLLPRAPRPLLVRPSSTSSRLLHAGFLVDLVLPHRPALRL